jgi:hypothetical protein
MKGAGGNIAWAWITTGTLRQHHAFLVPLWVRV